MDDQSIQDTKPTTSKKDWVEELKDRVIAVGERDTTAVKLAGHYISKGYQKDDVVRILTTFNWEGDLQSDFTIIDIEKCVDSIWKMHTREAEPESEPSIDIDSLNLSEKEIRHLLDVDFSDTENAERWSKFYGEEFLWIEDLRDWWRFDGLRWVRGETEAEATMKLAAQIVFDLALKPGLDDTKRLQILKLCIQWKDSPGVKHALEMAHSINYKKSSDFDTNPWLFLCRNGVVDLRTGNFRKPLATDYLHKSSNAEFNPDALCPRWIQFLNEIFLNNQDLIRYVQRWCGYTLTGDSREQKFLICEGPGQNGKSTFLEIIAWILGSWGILVPFSTFKEAKWDVPGAHHHADVMQFQGRRFVRSVEVKERAQLNIERLKALTGGEPMSGRAPYARDYVEFMPVAKVWLAVNHLPKIYDTTLSCWRRLVRIPFSYVVPEDKKNKELPDELKAEGSGILNWMIAGCLDWQRYGLGETPIVVKNAIEEYQVNSAPVRRFVNERCLIGKYQVAFTLLYEAFVRWWHAEEGEILPMSKKAFGQELSRMGFEDRTGSRNAHFRSGLRLVEWKEGILE